MRSAIVHAVAFERDSIDLLIAMRELLKSKARMGMAPTMLNSTST